MARTDLVGKELVHFYSSTLQQVLRAHAGAGVVDGGADVNIDHHTGLQWTNE